MNVLIPCYLIFLYSPFVLYIFLLIFLGFFLWIFFCQVLGFACLFFKREE